PLPKSERGHEYILVMMDYANRYPNAVPFQKATSLNTVYLMTNGGSVSAFTDPKECTLVRRGEELSPAQQQDLVELFDQFNNIFSAIPGLLQLVQHEIKTPPGMVVRQWPYRVLEAHRQAIEEEVERILRDGVIEESASSWSSPKTKPKLSPKLSPKLPSPPHEAIGSIECCPLASMEPQLCSNASWTSSYGPTEPLLLPTWMMS
ncbi:hypothetical protein QTP70_021108, partial [Hemibagrus guttatus]